MLAAVRSGHRTRYLLLLLGFSALGVFFLLGQLGSRFGSIQLGAFSSGWLWLAGALVFSWAPASPDVTWTFRRRLVVLVLALVVALLGARLYRLASTVIESAGSLKTEASLRGEVGRRQRSGVTDLRALSRYLPFNEFLDNRARTRLDVSGFFFAPESGTYRFTARGSDPVVVTVDGLEVLDFSEGETRVELSGGVHAIRLEMTPEDGEGFVDLDWDRPAWAERLAMAYWVSASPNESLASQIASNEKRAAGLILFSGVVWLLASWLLLTLGAHRASLLRVVRRWSEEPPAWSGWRETVALAAVLFTVGLVLALPALSYPMAFDDLVLLRSVSAAQILSSFYGHWDPEHLMTGGFRPGSLIFNHVRYRLFGENVVAHRALLLFLYALYGAILVSVAARIGTERRAAAIAVVLALCSVFSVFHYVWITDGNHMVQGVAFVVAAWLLLSGLDGRSRARLVGSLVAILAGLLTREDTFAAIPALILLGLFTSSRSLARLRWVAIYAGSLLLLAIALYYYRRWAVPRAAPFGYDVLGLLGSIGQTFEPAGGTSFDFWSRAASIAWWVSIAASAALAFRHREPSSLRRMALWFACAILACVPTLTLSRDNMFFFPISFSALGFAELFASASRRGRLGMLVAAAGIAAGIGGGFRASRVFAENFHPRSLRVLWWNGRYVYGAYSEKAVIPDERLARVKAQLASVGIRDEERHLHHTRYLERRALAMGRRRPDGSGRLFYPLLPWGED